MYFLCCESAWEEGAKQPGPPVRGSQTEEAAMHNQTRKGSQEKSPHYLPIHPPPTSLSPLLFSLLSFSSSLPSHLSSLSGEGAGSRPALPSFLHRRELLMTMRRVASTPVPEWLETLLSTRFFLACGAHPASPRNECNMFCLDCRGAPPPAFCYYCRAHRHAAHRVIQIRRSSYHDVVRVSEVEDVLDITGVQTYVINSARVLFLNERPQPRGAGAAAGKAAASPYNCEICGRALLDPFRFCSLGCKLVDTKRGNGHAAEGGASHQEAEAGGSKSRQGRRRKGIPHRAPFWS